MNINHAAASIAAFTILAGVPAIALADTANDPIVVNHENVAPASQLRGPGFVSVSFDNSSKTPVTEVVFELDVDGAYAGHFNDVGTFAPGVKIKHSYLTTSEAADQKLEVASVKFADGSVWVNESAANQAADQAPDREPGD
jgi:hypothetical protein